LLCRHVDQLFMIQYVEDRLRNLPSLSHMVTSALRRREGLFLPETAVCSPTESTL
jgi:hypothetical protein